MEGIDYSTNSITPGRTVDSKVKEGFSGGGDYPELYTFE